MHSGLWQLTFAFWYELVLMPKTFILAPGVLTLQVQSSNIPTKLFVKIILALSFQWCVDTLGQSELEQQSAQPPEIKYESKYSVYCVQDCSLQVSDKPNLQFYTTNVVCFTRICDLSHICRNWVKWWEKRTARRLVKTIWLQHFSFQNFLFRKWKLAYYM